MIEPTETDIGRGVVYYDGRNGEPSPEDGVITSFNASYVFVRYGGDQTSKATRRENLYWRTQ